MTSVWFVSPAWGRFAVTRLVLEQRRRLCGELASRGLDARMVIVADDANLDIARQFGADTVEAPNLPVGRKFNQGLRYAGEQGADWIVWIGSDDWVHPDVFDALPDEPEAGVWPIVHGRRLGVVDLRSGMLLRCKSPSRYGAIPWLLHRSVFERSRFAPVRERNRGLDGLLIRGLRQSRAPLAWRMHDPHELRCVDFKSATNITPFERLRHLAIGGEESAWPALEERYPADLVALARDLHIDLQEGAACPS